MHWFVDLLTTGSASGSVLIIALVAALGFLLGSLRLRGVSLGVAGVLFTGLIFGHIGVAMDPEVTEFARDLSLALFVYAIGVAAGPGFFEPLRRHGIGLCVIALGGVLIGSLLAAAISRIAGIATPAAVGLLAGASTNTPSLGAAQTALQDMPGYTQQMGELAGLGYAVCYPFGVIGLILVMIVMRPLFRGQEPSGAGLIERSGGAEGALEVERPGEEPAIESPTTQQRDEGSVQVLPIFIGLAAGCVLGSIPIPVRGLAAPLRLGVGGGSLVVAIALSARERIGPLSWRMPSGANTLLRDVGIAVFLSCVGLIAGRDFAETITAGDGLKWMAWGVLVTLVPAALVALAGWFAMRGHYASVCGILAGCSTNPASLAFAAAATRSDAPTTTYAMVYPLTMVLRVLATQIFVLLLTR